jgi:hypothetical protein
MNNGMHTCMLVDQATLPPVLTAQGRARRHDAAAATSRLRLLQATSFLFCDVCLFVAVIRTEW